MNKTLLLLAALAVPAAAMAQSAVDVYTLSQTDQRGTARFMAMGGAFTALGGDLSTLTQNPAGIGVYRRSEIGATLDISPSKITSLSATTQIGTNKTKAYCNNFGYVGTAQLGGALRSFSWGVTYNRMASFDRVYNVYDGATSSSLSNYIAAITGNVNPDDLDFTSSYNPYLDSNNDWLSILGYTTYMINPLEQGGYRGLYANGTEGDAYAQVHQTGYVDEYAIDFGGNVDDIVYWGIGFGITDLSFNQSTIYSESMANADIVSEQGIVKGDAGFELTNFRSFSGSGFNMKFGVILKPIQELRIGLAVHTPTWYSLSQSAYAENSYSYYNPTAPEGDRRNPIDGNDHTEDSYYNFHMTTPWKIMVGAAAVLGNSAIVSLDYEHQAFSDMKMSYQDQWGNFVSDDYVNDDIKNYYKATNILRAGIEYRVTRNFSLRAGYSYTSTNVKDEAANGNIEVFTSGTNPAYVFDKDANAVSLGLGYRYQAFYIDAAYVYRKQTSTYHAYTDYADVMAPTARLTRTTNDIVLSLGFKF